MVTELINNLKSLDFSPASKVWIYTSDKTFNEAEENAIYNDLEKFCSNWESHGRQLAAKSFILYARLIVLVVDDSFFSISGCAMDKSVAFIKKLEMDYNISLFDRLLQTAYYHEQWITYPTVIWSEKLKSSEINSNTWFIDTMVNNLHDAQHNLEKKLGDFWLKRII